MKVSIIIPVFNKLDYTQKCLESIFSKTSRFDFEVIVIDNASIDGTRLFLENNEKIKVISNESNLGFAKACNQGAKMANGEYLLFLNNDTVVTEGWLDAMVEELDSDGEIGIVGSKLLYPNETIQHAGVVFMVSKSPYHIYRQANKDEPFVNKKRLFKAVTGACLMIRKGLFEQVKGFDEQYKNGYEDIDLCLKLDELGKKIVYVPESVVYHYESMTEGRKKFDGYNHDLFIKKWASKITEDDVNYYIEDDTLMSQFQKLEERHVNLRLKLEIANQEIEDMKSSKFWKLRNAYMKIKNILK